MTSTRRSVAVFALLLSAALGFGTAYQAVIARGQSCNDSSDCNGNGAGGGSGGCGGGMCSGGSGGGSPEPSDGNGSAGGGTGGNGSSGNAGGNNIRTPTPAPQPVSNSTGSGSGSASSRASSTSSSSLTTPAPDASLDSWAKQLNTTTEEIQSWFGSYTTKDTIGGQASAITVHPDDQVTIFDGASAAESNSSGSGLRMGIHGIGDTRTKGGDGVDISLHSTAVPIGSTVTDAGGAFTANVQVPHDTAAGRHFIIALAPNTKQGRAAFVFPVSVQATSAAGAAADTPSEPTQAAKRFPWVLIELIVGSVSVIALFIYRVRRAAA